MNRRVAFYGTMIVLSLQTQSCFFNGRLSKREKANQCCSFDPVQNKLVLNCGNVKIIFIEISVSSMQEGVSGTTFYKQSVDPPVNELLFPNIPDSIKYTRNITIDIWNSNQVIYDYSIGVTPEDWKTGKLVYGHYSYR